MALVTTKQLMLDAQAGGYAIGAFNVENMEMVQAVVAAAEELREYPDTIDPKKYNARGREEVKKYVMDKIRVCGSCGKA